MIRKERQIQVESRMAGHMDKRILSESLKGGWRQLLEMKSLETQSFLSIYRPGKHPFRTFPNRLGILCFRTMCRFLNISKLWLTFWINHRENVNKNQGFVGPKRTRVLNRISYFLGNVPIRNLKKKKERESTGFWFTRRRNQACCVQKAHRQGSCTSTTIKLNHFKHFQGFQAPV